MNPELITIPPAGIAVALFAFVVFLVVALSAAVLGAGRLVRGAAPAGELSLADKAEPLLRARSGVGRFDAQFDRLAEGTNLGLTGEAAAGWIVLVAALAASGVYFLTFDELLAGGAALLGGGVTLLVFWTLQNRRRRAIQEQLPDGCFQLSRSLRSGLNLPAALHETSAYVPRPLAQLFERLAAAVSLGEATRPAVRRVAADANVTEFDLFTEVLALNSEAGGNLPAMLDRLAASIRDRNQFRGYFRSVTTLARVGAIFLALAAPAAFVLYLIFQPEMLSKFVSLREGQYMLAAAIVLEIIGLLWIGILLRRQDDY